MCVNQEGVSQQKVPATLHRPPFFGKGEPSTPRSDPFLAKPLCRYASLAFARHQRRTCMHHSAGEYVVNIGRRISCPDGDGG